ncbi:hypothetical protein ACFO6Q_12800 [Dokdonella ginsengisoli]|uniref:Uncharacterized protein n=2 Tax=Dokdonella ginsengisoli TaxID=363846 RepID=A0ABV9QV18_9GAMM
MKSLVRGLVLAAGMVVAAGAYARSDVRDGNAMVQPVKSDRYSIDGSTMGKAELFGYISDLKDREELTGIVLKKGGSDEQRKSIGSIARTLQLKAFEQVDGELKPIDQPAAAPAPPPIENKPEAAPAAEATPAPPAH